MGLGKFLLLDQGVGTNIEEAVRSWTWTAEKGNASAQFNLTGLYASGKSVKRDLQKAYSLYSLAGKTLNVSEQLGQISLVDFQLRAALHRFGERAALL